MDAGNVDSNILSPSAAKDATQQDWMDVHPSLGAGFNNIFGSHQRDDFVCIDTQNYQYGSEVSFAMDPQGQSFGSSDSGLPPMVGQEYFAAMQSSPMDTFQELSPLDLQLTNLDLLADEAEQDSTTRQRRRSPIRYLGGLINTSESPLNSGNLAEAHNRHDIKKGLLKIYHDSLEGALSCWLTERNCPYASSAFADKSDVWSSNWSNRMMARIRALDKTYSNMGLISKSNQKQASRVLGLVTMAFAVQWAQTAYGKHDNLSTQLPEHGVFGRNMQQTLWHEANLALGQASGNPSFEVIFAGIIFSLTQRPRESTEGLSDSETHQCSISTSLRKILDDDSGPIFLDVAVRKLHDHRRRLKDAKCSNSNKSPARDASFVLAEQDKETFELTFWLAIMFDTISAAMNRRSFALDDRETRIEEDGPRSRVSQHDDTRICDLDAFTGFYNMTGSDLIEESQIWGDYFLRQRSRIGESRKQTVRWPCSYEDAAACLADAAPVKVLVFRRLGHLQDLFYQRAPAEEIETAITATLEVCNHWKSTYGLFIADCIAHHEYLPARIQSWYILLASHWHLAIFLLADLVEKLDDLNMSLPANRTARQTTEFAALLRVHSASTVSDLGRCCQFRNNEDLSFSQSPFFHHAVNKAALLTEPWTVVLVRSFAYAGEHLLKFVLPRRGPAPMVDIYNMVEARKRLNDCIQALWLLGRKSDMALCAAKLLQEAADQGVAWS
ncbi:hypothetical protein LTR10_017953 [Elasticomyces elasticus]|uniref:Transcription factor domain-containing protein n=1 Tax=Exophiala sideris TaxID=1016849 RepID=A0ABR0IYI5_9EURO|nr:hypothetical protein LTR10_017953 [Elasticomyces elasticus]KAK5021754.1 hypothetical protein LTS07_010649 [Exophiala sideris]KAK5025885.1 hypothetical protein LTR13_010349 [Exophiala sideris]KAK5050249.1 hypothetical protein LTR69_010737 [Exophiala sideris]KAK5176991.1 hypothetical protein LTR44_010428 [Eurotiomycetes sp. CCFEE 6388]